MGLEYGSKTGIKNQSPLMQVILSKELTYYHKLGIKVTFGPRTSSLRIVKSLQELNCGSVIKTPTTLSKMLIPDKIGLRKSLYGWSLVAITVKTEKDYLNLGPFDIYKVNELPDLPSSFPSISYYAADQILAELKEKGVEQKKELFLDKSSLTWKDIVELL